METTAKDVVTKLEETKESAFIGEYFTEEAASLLDALMMNPTLFKVDITCPSEFSAQMEDWLRRTQPVNMVGLNPKIPGLDRKTFFKARVYKISNTHFEVNYYCKDAASLDKYLIPNPSSQAIAAAFPDFMKKKDENGIKVSRQKGVFNIDEGEYERNVV